MLGHEYLALAVHVEDVDAGDAMFQEHEVLIRWLAIPDLKADTRPVARRQVEVLGNGQVDPRRGIAAERRLDRTSLLGPGC